MKTLWTPWRMEHVVGNTRKISGCLFEPPGNTPNNRERLLLFRDHLCVVLLNGFPYANGHLLVAPRRHIGDITDLNTEENSSLMALLQNSCTILRNHFKPDGINIGLNLGEVAGAGIADHLHFHVIPRWEGDHNFMTTVAEVRTIPQHIENTFDQLLPDFQTLIHIPGPTTHNQ